MILRDYQITLAGEIVKRLQTLGIAYLAAQVRTGKTATSLQAAHDYLSGLNLSNQLVLFITKKKAISSIMSDAAALDVKYDLLVINYEQIQNVEQHIKKNVALVIIDEAHSLGAYPKPSERTKQLKQFIFTRPVIFLSGTPSPESYSQIYHQFFIHSLSPFAQYANFYAWAKDFVYIKQKRYAHGLVNDYSNANKDKVEQAIKPYMITFTQEEAGFTEMVNEYVIDVQMQTSTYAFAKKLTQDRVVQNKDGDVVMADTNGSVIVDQPERTSAAFDNTKALLIKDKFKGQKIAIFYKFIAELQLLRAAFGKRIVETPEEFRDASNDAIYVSQIQSGREGINLSSAYALIMFNIDFSAVSYFQARARMQSRERTTPAKLYWIFAKDGIEHKIYKRVLNKEDYTISYFKKDFGL
jgi:hypothetical protein